jgi:hypothetical protein
MLNHYAAIRLNGSETGLIELSDGHMSAEVLASVEVKKVLGCITSVDPNFTEYESRV